MQTTPDRRSVIRALGALTISGTIAGCSGGGSTESSTPDETESESGSGNGVPAAVSEYLSGTGNFDGTLTDERDADAVTVQVGAEGNGGAFAFAPAAIKISPGTTVTWEWTGNGSLHNVVAEDGAAFESEQTSEEGYTFEQTFEETGVVTYYCLPHQGIGMKGAIVIE
jgi:halocyanin-like protein